MVLPSLKPEAIVKCIRCQAVGPLKEFWNIPASKWWREEGRIIVCPRCKTEDDMLPTMD